ncbi:MAG TPA: hypothetical protein VGE98_07090 [Thermoanaerobaculia bacterium]
MKRVFSLLAVLTLAAAAAFAQESQHDDDNPTRAFKSKVLEIHHRDPGLIADAVRLLGSGFKGAGLAVNAQLHTIAVRDFPENVVAIEEAVKRLDQPAPATPDIELKISVLIGSKSPIEHAPPVPDDLAPVVAELRSTLRYSHYAMLTAAVHHAKPGGVVEGSGIAEPTALGLTVRERQPILYSYRLRPLALASAGDRPALSTDGFEFSMKMPIDVGSTTQYQPVGFETPVTIHPKEQVVIGTTTLGEKALIVVVSANLKSPS